MASRHRPSRHRDRDGDESCQPSIGTDILVHRRSKNPRVETDSMKMMREFSPSRDSTSEYRHTMQRESSGITEARQEHHQYKRGEGGRATEMECRDGAPSNDDDDYSNKWEEKNEDDDEQQRESSRNDVLSVSTSISNSRSVAGSKTSTAAGSTANKLTSFIPNKNYGRSSSSVALSPKNNASPSISRSRSDCNASRMTGYTSMATPRASNTLRQSNLNVRTTHHELEPLHEDPAAATASSKPFKSRTRSKENEHQGSRRPPPVPSTTPKSHVAVDEEGKNNIDITNNNYNQGGSIVSASISKRSGFKRFLHRRSNSNVSSITGATKGFQTDEVDYGIDPTRGSFDLVIVPTGSRSTGISNSKSKKNKKPKATAEASAAASLSASTVVTYDTKNLTYWSSLSVRAAMAVIQAKGSEVMAQKAANAVLEEGKKKHKCDLRTLATKISVVVLEAGGDHMVAAAVAVAIMNEEDSKRKDGRKENRSSKGKNKLREEEEEEDDDSTVMENESSIPMDIPAGISEEWLNSRPTPPTPKPEEDPPSETSSMASKRRDLQEKEDEIENRNRALSNAARLNLEKERAIQQRMKVLDAAAAAAERKAVERAAEERRKAAERAAAEKKADERAAEERKKAAERAAAEKKADEKAAAQAAKRRQLQQQEEEIERRNKALEERTRAMKRQEETERSERTMAQAAAAAEKSLKIFDNIPKSFSYTSNADLASTTASMVSHRRHLEEKEAEIAQRNRALEEASRLNLQREAEIRKRMEALDAATTAVANKTRQRHLQAKEDAKRNALQEKEEQIAKRNRELEEAARLNLQKEKEISERMAALDAATAALLERANNVQDEIDRRVHSGLGRVDEGGGEFDNHHNDGGVGVGGHSGGLTNPEFDRQISRGPHQQQHEMMGPRANINHGEISVATPNSKTYEFHGGGGGPPQYGDFNRGYGNMPNNQGNNANGPPHHQQPSPPPLQQSKSKGVFEQLTGKFYSILDVACDSAAWAPSRGGTLASQSLAEDTLSRNTRSQIPFKEEYNAPFNKEGTSYYSRRDEPSYYLPSAEQESHAYPEPPRFKSPTLSGLTDDQRTWNSRYNNHQNDNAQEQDEQVVPNKSPDNRGSRPNNQLPNHVLNQALNQQGRGMDHHNNQQQHANGGGNPNQLLNDALNQAMNQQQSSGHPNGNPTGMTEQNRQPANGSSPDQLLNDALNQAMDQQQNVGSPNGNPTRLDTNEALNQALNQAMNQVGSAHVTQHPPMKSSNGPPSVLKQPSRASGPKPNNDPPKSRVTKLKVGFLSSFSKKATLSPAERPANNNRKNNNNSNNKPQSSGSMRMKRQDQRAQILGGGAPNNKKASPKKKMMPAGSTYMASNKANMISPPRNNNQHGGVSTPENNPKKGQLFSFSRKRSKLVEI